MTQDENASNRQFGPMTPPQPAAASPAISEDRIVARILAALGQNPQSAAGSQSAAAPPPLTEEDQRLIAALAGVHASGKQVVILLRDELVARLFFVIYAYTPASGTRQTACALVYDDGQRSHVFGGFYNG